SSETRHALTVALVKPGRGACWNQSINSSSAMLYTRFVIGDETLSSTSVFNFCHCAIFSRLIKSFILGPVIWALSVGYVMWTLPPRGWKIKTEAAQFTKI